MKPCTGCGLPKRDSEFYEDRTRNRIHPRCKACMGKQAMHRYWNGGRELRRIREDSDQVRKQHALYMRKWRAKRLEVQS